MLTPKRTTRSTSSSLTGAYLTPQWDKNPMRVARNTPSAGKQGKTSGKNRSIRLDVLLTCWKSAFTSKTTRQISQDEFALKYTRKTDREKQADLTAGKTFDTHKDNYMKFCSI